MNLKLDDLLARVTAEALRDAEPDDSDAATRHGRDRSTMNRHRNHGRGSPVFDAHKYIMNARDPMRVAASLLATAKHAAVLKLSDGELRARWWELGEVEKVREGDDNANDVSRVFCGRATALCKERDGAVNLERAAVARELVRRALKP